MYKKIAFCILTGLLITSCTAFSNPGLASKPAGYAMITVSELQELMDSEEFTLVNVHIPLEGNIFNTDAEIPFNEIENYLDLLPEDKDEKIVVYCRSGSMGDTASQTLVDLGYTDVSNLEGGYNAWKANGLPFEEKS